MEDILDLYEEPYDPKRPVIGVDERPCQLIGDVVMPIPMKPGKPKKEDNEYERNGTCCVFIACEPLQVGVIWKFVSNAQSWTMRNSWRKCQRYIWRCTQKQMFCE